MNASVAFVPGQIAYMHIPATELRGLVDHAFSGLAKDQIADTVAGNAHRWMDGHDLLIDIPDTLAKHGVRDALHQAGHVILTDFPTKAGIPIPLFSDGGLGHFLTYTLGIPRGWLSLNIMDAGVGVWAVAEGHADLVAAVAGTMHMNAPAFFDTFVEGGVELALAFYTQNPLLLAGGLENVTAGLVSAWKTVSVYVDPNVFFGACVTSALIGGGLAYILSHQEDRVPDTLVAAARSGIVGGLFSVSQAFGFGAIAGLVAFELGHKLAGIHTRGRQLLLSIDRHSYEHLIETLNAGSPDFVQLWKVLEQPCVRFLDVPPLEQDEIRATDKVPVLDGDAALPAWDTAIMGEVPVLDAEGPLIEDATPLVFGDGDKGYLILDDGHHDVLSL